MRDIEPHMYLDRTGLRIELGDLLTVPTNLNANGKPIMFKGIMVCVGRHNEDDNIFVRYMGDEMIHRFHPAKLQIITPSARNRQPSLAKVA